MTGQPSRKYSEIVWLPMSRIASTSTNADRLTGLPNTYTITASRLIMLKAEGMLFPASKRAAKAL